MELGTYISSLRQDLAVAAAAGGQDAQALAERLTGPLESATRLVLLDALSAAADEITRDLAPGSVHLQLRGREPSFVVTPPLAEPPPDPEPVTMAAPAVLPPVPADGEDDAMTRINFRLGETLKSRIEEAAEQAGLSLNSWLIRAAAAALDPAGPSPRPDRRAARGSQRLTGWVH
jgi:HicB family